MRSLVAAALALALAGGATREASQPEGRVVLTVGGDLAAGAAPGPSLGGVGLARQLDLEYKAAVAFDDAMLAALPQHEVVAALFGAPRAAIYSGPLLADVLRASGAQGRSVRPVALDGYAVEIDRENIERFRPILATHADGRPLPIGGLGPLAVVYPAATFAAHSDALVGLQVYAVFFIVVR